jgi:hypothetical protein
MWMASTKIAALTTTAAMGQHDSEADAEAVSSERTRASAEGGKERGGDHRDSGCRQQEQAADPGQHGIRAAVPGNTPGDVHQVLYCLCHP